jgi:hypothetical protein
MKTFLNKYKAPVAVVAIAIRLLLIVAVILGVILGCGGSPPPPSIPSLEVIPAVTDGKKFLPLDDGDVVSLDLAPQGPVYVIYLTAGASQVLQPGAKLSAQLKIGDAVIGKAEASIAFKIPAAVPAFPNPVPVLMLPACFSELKQSVESTEVDIVFTLQEVGGNNRSATATRHVVPACRYLKATDQLRCHRACTR